MKQMITDEPRFLKWAADKGQYPSNETFERWQGLGWVLPAEEGWALTIQGRRIAKAGGE